jgi:hypothetical protein
MPAPLHYQPLTSLVAQMRDGRSLRARSPSTTSHALRRSIPNCMPTPKSAPTAPVRTLQPPMPVARKVKRWARCTAHRSP